MATLKLKQSLKSIILSKFKPFIVSVNYGPATTGLSNGIYIFHKIEYMRPGRCPCTLYHRLHIRYYYTDLQEPNTTFNSICNSLDSFNSNVITFYHNYALITRTRTEATPEQIRRLYTPLR